MRRLISLIIAVAVLIGCAKTAQAPTYPAPSPEVQYLKRRTVLIDVDCPDGSGWGSAVILGGRRLLTANHVVDDPSCTYKAKRTGEEFQPAEVVVQNPDLDLAYIEVPKPYRVYSEKAPVVHGQEIICTGYSQVIIDGRTPHLSVTRGEIATVGLRDGLVRSTAPARFGHSGGPCWSQGKVVGLVVSGAFARVPMQPPIGYPGSVYLRPVYGARVAAGGADDG